ncbi:hypothetical protein [Clostridium sp. KNHs214]|uniref:hypothetical protein n=1 Tax=Clostridium sp. KNHs214 TaxID=1540257 RepID=UPI0005592905|nr:hypothetical protein [Clostridium sp. KNHs214]
MNCLELLMVGVDCEGKCFKISNETLEKVNHIINIRSVNFKKITYTIYIQCVIIYNNVNVWNDL